MSARADDLRFHYGEAIGITQIVTAAAGAATPLNVALEPGRYILRVLDYGGGTAVWAKQGVFGTVVAEADEPSTQFLASTDVAVLNAPLAYFTVHGGNSSNPPQDNGLSFYAVGGTGAAVHVTKVSHGRG